MDDSSRRDSEESQQRAADPTIVGGRPLGTARPQASIPRGIEVLVKRRPSIPSFANSCLKDAHRRRQR